jgi:hypothetical protein
LRQLQKVTRFFGFLALAVLVFGLAFAAKHGQFEPETHHGHFLAKSVKMESVSPQPHHFGSELDTDSGFSAALGWPTFFFLAVVHTEPPIPIASQRTLPLLV